MVDIPRRGAKAAETIIGGMYAAASYDAIRDGFMLSDVGYIMGLAVIVMVLFIAIGRYYERRNGEPL